MLSTSLYVSCGDDDDDPDDISRDLEFAFSDGELNVYSDGTLFYYLTDDFLTDHDLEAWICGMEPSKSKVVIPSHVRYYGKNYRVEFDGGAFEHCTNLKQVTIPNTITIIEDGAFEGCSSLTNVNIPNSIIEIRNSAFEGCTRLKTIELGNSVRKISYRAFANSGLESITIPKSESGTEIGEEAFSECSYLKNVYISNSVTSIGKAVFYKCWSIKSMTIPKWFEGVLFYIFGDSNYENVKFTFI